MDKKYCASNREYLQRRTKTYEWDRVDMWTLQCYKFFTMCWL
jgi:hypothetical protein